eukprot:s18_g4.t1
MCPLRGRIWDSLYAVISSLMLRTAQLLRDHQCRPVNEPRVTSELREASQRVAARLAEALQAEGVYVNRILLELPARYLDITMWRVNIDERAAWMEHPHTLFMDSEEEEDEMRVTGSWVERQRQRLRVVTWNTGGLSNTRYNEIIEWLTQEAQRGHPVDVMFLQETCWKQDLEDVATPPAVTTPESLSYQVVHSAGQEKTGVMCLIRTGVVPTSGIRYMSSLAGRLLHVRLMFEAALDLLGVYQHPWKPGKASLGGHR